VTNNTASSTTQSRLLHLVEKLSMRKDRLLYYTTKLCSHKFFSRQKAASLGALLREAETRADFGSIMDRVDYYNRLGHPFEPSDSAASSSGFHRHALSSSLNEEQRVPMGSAYFFDFVSLSDYFSHAFRFDYAFGDTISAPRLPAFVKSRPIEGNNENSILLKLNARRHFYFVKDTLAFTDKKGQAIFRGACHRPHRQQFVGACHGLPDTNIGDIRPSEIGKPTYKSPISIKEHLRYKFVISVEGNDVATNLKWIMSSNSLCFMTKPKYETWFMEGRLLPDHHYVLLRDDYADLNEKIDYYNQNPDKALQIIANAQRWVEQFKDLTRERLIGLLVMKKYIALSGQQ
jgi:hypothetical protein